MGHPLEVIAQKKKESIYSIKNAIGLYSCLGILILILIIRNRYTEFTGIIRPI